ncbi:MAG TPA: hypothetical protein VER33_19920 [Polyangiaceae bacterium]|nr:hypothetical protein [Polyangiaceae bacterium]
MRTEVPSCKGPLRRLVPVGAVALSMGMTSGCGDLAPCPGAQLGASVEVEVLGRAEHEPACQDAYGFAPGTVIAGKIVDLRGEFSCKSGELDVAGAGEWTWALDRDGTLDGGVALEGRYTLTRGSCSAYMRLGVRTGPSLACDAKQGEDCELHAVIGPEPRREADCPEVCSLTLGVRVKRL